MTATTIPFTQSKVESVNGFRRPASADLGRFILPAAFAATAVLGGLGAVGSFLKVSTAAAAHGINPSWLLPVGVDGAIAVFTVLDLALAREGKRVGWLRFMAWGLIAATVALNVSDSTDVFGVVAHAALPLLWAAAVEAAKAAMVTRRTEAPDRIPFARWAYAPVNTLLLHRRMNLWQITSYADALDREQDRVLARCDLIEKHGKVRKAPARQRELYRLGLLAPATHTYVEPAPRDETPRAENLERGPRLTKRPQTYTPRRPAPPARSDAEMLAACRKVATDLGIEPKDLTRKLVQDAGVKGKTDRIAAAIRTLKEDQ